MTGPLPRLWDTFDPDCPEGQRRLSNLIALQAIKHWRMQDIHESSRRLLLKSRDLWLLAEGRRCVLLNEAFPRQGDFFELLQKLTRRMP